MVLVPHEATCDAGALVVAEHHLVAAELVAVPYPGGENDPDVADINDETVAPGAITPFAGRKHISREDHWADVDSDEQSATDRLTGKPQMSLHVILTLQMCLHVLRMRPSKLK